MDKLEEEKGLFQRFIDDDLRMIEPIKERESLLRQLGFVYEAYDKEIENLNIKINNVESELKAAEKENLRLENNNMMFKHEYQFYEKKEK